MSWMRKGEAFSLGASMSNYPFEVSALLFQDQKKPCSSEYSYIHEDGWPPFKQERTTAGKKQTNLFPAYLTSSSFACLSKTNLAIAEEMLFSAR